MHRFVFVAASAAFFSLLVFPSTALTQDRSPELERLGFYVGEWTLDGGDQGSGTMACEWLGTRVLKCDSEFTFPSGVTQKTVGVWTYNPNREYYTWLRYWGSGGLDDHIGWVDGNTWTWMQRDSAGRHYRFVMVEDSPTVMTSRNWQSFFGGEWELLGDMTMTKVR